MNLLFHLVTNMAIHVPGFLPPFSFPSSRPSPDFFATKTSQKNPSIKQDVKNIINFF